MMKYHKRRKRVLKYTKAWAQKLDEFAYIVLVITASVFIGIIFLSMGLRPLYDKFNSYGWYIISFVAIVLIFNVIVNIITAKYKHYEYTHFY